MSPRRALHRILALGRSRQLDAELNDEIAAHLELAERDLVATGLSRAEARRVARQRFGGVEPIKEAHRDSRSARWLELWWRDLRLGVRGLRRAPGFCAAAVLILGLSIGANTTMFSAVRAILLQPLAYADPDRLVVVLHGGRFPVAPANFLDWRAQTRSFEAMGAAEMWSPNLGLATGAERVKGLRVSPETLQLLGVAPLHGRLLAGGATEAAELRTVVIGHALWQQRFGSAADVVGRPLRLDGESYTVVGVMPPHFRFAPFWATESGLWAPLPLDARRQSRGGNSLRLFARLKPGVDVAAAQADIDLVTARLEQAFPGTNRGVQVVPLKERVVGHTRLGLSVLLVAVGLVLLIACANVAHMLLARAASRQSEIAVRLALGATRLQIIRQLLTESLLLAALSSVVGLVLAVIGVRVIAATAPADLPRAADMAIEGWTLGFTLALTVLTGVVFGLVPAWQAARTRIGDRLAARGVAGHKREALLRDLLVVSEMALALVLLIGAGLTLRGLAAASAIDPGFEPRGLLSMSVSVQGSSAAGPGQRAVFFPAAVEALRRLPGVDAASAVNHAPLVGDLWTRGFDIAGRAPRGPGDDRPGAVYRVVLPGYFATMRLPIVQGRDIAPADTRLSPDVVVVSESLVRRHFSAGDAIGQRIAMDEREDGTPRWMTVVGVVRDAVGFTWDGGTDPTIYLPYLQSASYLDGREGHQAYLTLLLRTSGDPAALAGAARRAIWAVHPGVSISETTTMTAAVDRALARPRFQSALLASFATLALVLAAAGIYGVMSYAVARRTREIGLRLTLGARRGDVLRLILGQAARRLAVGGAIGLAGAWLSARALTTLLYGVRPTDALTFAAVPAILAVTALAASYLPARRASRVDPMVAMRIDG